MVQFFVFFLSGKSKSSDAIPCLNCCTPLAISSLCLFEKISIIKVWNELLSNKDYDEMVITVQCIYFLNCFSLKDATSKLVFFPKMKKKMNKRPMGHNAHLRKQFKSINTYDYIIMLIKRRKKINFMITYCFFIWILTQGCFVPKLVEIGSVVLEKRFF